MIQPIKRSSSLFSTIQKATLFLIVLTFFSSPLYAADTDADNVNDPYDNCLILANPSQADSNQDGYGNLCDCDFNNDAVCNQTDGYILYLHLLYYNNNGTLHPDAATWGVDMNSDGAVTTADISRFNSQGSLPGPSGLSCAGTIPCFGQTSVCGDGVLAYGEQCEFNDLNGKMCSDFGNLTGGTLACKGDCTYDLSGCENSLCNVGESYVGHGPAECPFGYVEWGGAFWAAAWKTKHCSPDPSWGVYYYDYGNIATNGWTCEQRGQTCQGKPNHSAKSLHGPLAEFHGISNTGTTNFVMDWMLYSCEEQVAATCSPGSLPGAAGVSCLGAGTYTIPLEVPPGTNGVEPALSLSYNSQGPNGLLGMGWSLEGLSSISRCEANKAMDGFKDTVNYDEDDQYCLDGQRLVPIAPLGGSVQEYRTDPDSFVRVRSYGTTSTGADYFTVEEGSGLIREYGTSPDSRIEAQGASDVRVWALHKVTDPFTNYINYVYMNDLDTGEFWIEEISYTGNTTAGQLPYNFVKFDYVSRNANDVAKFYQGGSFVQTTKLLSRIRTCLSSACTGTDFVTDYRLTYQSGAATKRYQLKTVTQCDGQGTCLPSTTMTWSDEGSTDFSGNRVNGPNSTSLWGEDFGAQSSGPSHDSFITTHMALFADAFFPNFTALSRATDVSSMIVPTLSIGLSTLSFITAAHPGVALAVWAASGLVVYYIDWVNSAHDIPKGKLADVNGDGRTDIVEFPKDPLIGGNVESYVWLVKEVANGALPQFDRFEFDKIENWRTDDVAILQGDIAPDEVKLSDFDGDGMMDLMTFESQDGIVHTSNGSDDFVYNGMTAFSIGEINQSSLGDFDGDGKMDVAEFRANGHVHLSTGTSFNEQGQWPTCEFLGLPCSEPEDYPVADVILGDVNGDGKTDVVRIIEGPAASAEIWLANKNGNGWVATAPVSFGFGLQLRIRAQAAGEPPDIVQPGDFNGDGKMDLAVFISDDTSGSHTNSNGIELFNASPLKIYLSTGRTFEGDTFSEKLLNGDNAPFAKDYPNGTDISFLARLADFNGDGKTDLMIFDATANKNARLYLSDGNRFLSEISWGSGFGLIDEVNLGDFEGDGRIDVLQFPRGGFAGEIHVTLSNRSPFPDLMTRITDGYGKVDEFTYRPITDDDVYECHTDSSGNCVTSPTGSTGYDSETAHFRGPMYVVSEKRTSNGTVNNGWHRTTYKYRGAKTHRSHGFLGFSRITASNPHISQAEITDYEQEYPLVCHKKGEIIETPGGPALINKVTKGFVWNVVPAVPDTSTNIVRLASETYQERDQFSTELTKSDLIEYTLYDSYNNVRNIRLSWPDVSLEVKNIAINYLNIDTPGRWILGLPVATTVVGSQPNPVPARVTTRQFDTSTGFLQSVTQNFLPSETLTTAFTPPDVFGNATTVAVSGTGSIPIAPRQTDIVYDTLGRFPESVTNAAGHFTQTSFEPKFGRLENLTDPNLLTTAWQYDGFGRETLETRPDMTTTQMNYCFAPSVADSPHANVTASWVQTVVSGEPAAVTFYDKRGREVRTSTAGFNGTSVYVDTEYDNALRLLSRSQPYYKNGTKASTVLEYNIFNRVSRVTYPHGEQTTFFYSFLGTLAPNPLGLSSDLLWRGISEKNTLNQTTYYVLNRLDQVNQVGHFAPNGTTLSTVTYDYDAFDNPVSMADFDSNITTRVYEDDRLKSIDDPDMGSWSYVYNVLGEVVQINDANTNQTDMDYDLLGRIISRSDPETNTSWDYDNAPGGFGIGELSSVSNSDGFAEEYDFDTFGRLASIDTTIPGSGTFSTGLTYDSSGRLETVSYPGASGLTVQNGYTSTGYLQSVSDLNTGRAFWTANALDAFSRVTNETHGDLAGANAVRSRYTYNTLPALVDMDIGYQINGITLLQSRKHLANEFNGLGNMTKRGDIDQSLIFPSEEYTYDDMNRLTFAATILDSVAVPHEFDYSPIGNLIFSSDLSGGNPNIFYGGAGPHAATSACNNTACPGITYDDNGNMISGYNFAKDQTRTIDWYSFNKPGLITQGTDDIAFEYNPYREKMRQVQTIGGAVTTTEYVGQLLEKVTLPSGIIENKNYIYGPTLGRPVAVLTTRTPLPTTTRYLYYDHLDSLTLVTDENAQVVEDMNFSPFGIRRDPDWVDDPQITSSVNRGFTNQEHLDEFDLIDMKGRMYDPSLGRFISADPYITDPFFTENLNRYSYVYNNPMTFTDPSGFQVNACASFCSKGASALTRNIGSAGLQLFSKGLTFTTQRDATQVAIPDPNLSSRIPGRQAPPAPPTVEEMREWNEYLRKEEEKRERYASEHPIVEPVRGITPVYMELNFFPEGRVLASTIGEFTFGKKFFTGERFTLADYLTAARLTPVAKKFSIEDKFIHPIIKNIRIGFSEAMLDELLNSHEVKFPRSNSRK